MNEYAIHVNTKGSLYLALAIICEVVATIFLKKTDGFSKLVPSLFVAVGYCFAFFFLTLSLKQQVPLSIGYAIWSGAGTAIVAVASVIIYHESLNIHSIVGIILIITGVVILNVYSEAH